MLWRRVGDRGSRLIPALTGRAYYFGMPTAVVTGASSGIGADFARELARDGYDVVLAARRVEPMQRLASELRTKTIVICCDLSKPGSATDLARELERLGIEVDVLINNAGLGGTGRFDQMDATRISEMLQVNMVALTELTRLLLPPMIARRRGRVLLVGSVAGYVPGPGMAVYYATKAYVLSFGEALAYELRGTGVTVTTLCPGATATNFAETAGNANTAIFQNPLMKPMSSAEVARLGYEGMKAGRRVVVTGSLNKIMAATAPRSPRAMALAIAARANQTH